ncbi:aldehyde dehydrogenase [Schizophyllum commune H4-8]|uniref:Aldehyde dehydrogenase domain-containing protein n=1 Tax=Schizophyllum commune (strain H4-8 / FGSC 9210) TaxID=578458 RepID=D8Q8W4_SCHCM|nr:aldehyde dehydrogenase [Schizophyllum commune H4-8]KAI5890648.1 aldehyde dehydrogenase [Schizophyllum commune H4-8]
MTTFTYEFNTPSFKGKVSFPTGVFLNGEFVDGKDKATIDVINPANGQLITKVSEATAADVDTAVKVAEQAFKTSWGLKASGTRRGDLLWKLGNLMDENKDELAALEALDNGKTFTWAKNVDVAFATQTIKYYAGWADKIQGKVIETDESKLTYTRHEPIGVVGQIIPWNFPLLMMAWKLGPALATGNAVVLKPSEFTPLTALRMCSLIREAGFPPGVVNVLVGYGHTVGQAISSHMDIHKVAFTGSTLVGRKIMETASKTNLKKVTLELGGKSPVIIFNDADLDQAVNWAAHGIFWNQGQACSAGSRIYVQSGIYDKFLAAFAARARAIKVGDPFGTGIDQGPQVSQQQYDRVMSFIDSGKQEGATLYTGGKRVGSEGYFIEPTVFTDTAPDMKIVREEIFGPVAVVVKFADEDDIVRQANDTVYGLAAAVFSQDVTVALETAHRLHAGTTWINCVNQLHAQVPFGGFKQSGIGRELGEYALDNYTDIKAVHVNLRHRM